MNTDISQVLWRLNPPMPTVVRAVYEAARAIKLLPREASVKTGEGHRSIVTIADEKSQELIASICQTIPGIKLLGEEDSDNPLFLSRDNPAGIMEGTRLVVDPIDGTVPFSHALANWSIGAGLLENGTITGGVVAAPATEEGVCLVSQKNRGAFVVAEGKVIRIDPVAQIKSKESVVLTGVDSLLYPNMTALLPTVALNVRALYTTGSGLWGLMMVSLGRAGAVIQTPQKAWDWVPGYCAILETGQVFRFFRFKDGEIIPVEAPDFKSFCYATKNRLGFVAGDPMLSENIFEILAKQKNWGRINPDTASGTW